MVEYAVKRAKDHLLNFTDLYEMICRNTISEPYVAGLEARDNIFPDLDFRIYADVE